MRCHYHPDREATGQCKSGNEFLCQECINQSTVGICRNCTQRIRHQETLKKRNSAKTDIRLFIASGIIGATILYGLLLNGMYTMEGGIIWALIPILALFSPLIAYGSGAGILGIKKLAELVWNNSIIISLLLLLLIIPIGLFVGPFVAPYWLYKARKTLRETAYIETLPESAFIYPTPPPYQPTQTTTTKSNFCPHCGAPINPEDNFCKACGKHT